MKKKNITRSKHESKEILSEGKQKFEVMVTRNQMSIAIKEEIDSLVTGSS